MSDHARLGASSASIWMTCRAAPGMWGDRERKGSIYTAEGSVAHLLAHSELIGDYSFRVGQKVEHEGFEIEVTRDMLDAVTVYVEEIERLSGMDPDFHILETKVHLDELWNGAPPPEPIFGTVDAAFVVGDTLYVRDLKYGKGVAVEVTDNPQLLFYGLGALFAMPTEVRSAVKWIDTGIVQPRCHHADGPVRSIKIALDDLMTWGRTLREAVDEIADEAAEHQLVTGKHCRFCVASGACPALANRAQALAKTSFKAANPATPSGLSNAELAEALDFADVIADWINKLRGEAMGRITNGQTIPGWKTVPKRAIRQWADPEKVLEYLVASGVDPKRIAELKVKTVAATERELKNQPDVFDTVRPLIVAESSGFNLARLDDDRPAVSPRRSAGSAFGAVSDDELKSLTAK